MHIVIPMSGTGKRFQEAGYTDPKPLIEVDGKPIIAHVIDLFPGETKFTFICSQFHLDNTPMREILLRYKPTAEIVAIPPHKKGPVYAVAQIFDRLDDEEEVIVNYCDFSTYWDYEDFLLQTRERNAAGAVVSYRGFHPHMLGSDNYAFILDDNQWMKAIQEKQPFTDDRTKEYASNGTYYFAKGAYVKKYFQELMDADIQVKGEYYVSMIYNLLVRDGLPVFVPEIQHMLQWGTPKDLQEYEQWSNYFKARLESREPVAPLKDAVTLIPMAGRGMRFQQEGYTDPKPLIEVNGRPMIVEATTSLPPTERYVFACLGEHLDNYPLQETLESAFPNVDIVRIDTVTEGQACTCDLALSKLENMDVPLLIGACDNGMLWDETRWLQLVNDPNVDVVAFSFRHHPASKRNPHMYGWLRTDEQDRVTGVSVKQPISDTPGEDHAIVGAFYFRKAQFFKEAYDQLIAKNIRVNGEFYVDSLMEELVHLGRTVKVFEVDQYVCWGTPDDLRTYEYWQSCFHKGHWHPYTLDADPGIPAEKLDALKAATHPQRREACAVAR